MPEGRDHLDAILEAGDHGNHHFSMRGILAHMVGFLAFTGHEWLES